MFWEFIQKKGISKISLMLSIARRSFPQGTDGRLFAMNNDLTHHSKTNPPNLSHKCRAILYLYWFRL